jgi:hypothetical protein
MVGEMIASESQASVAARIYEPRAGMHRPTDRRLDPPAARYQRLGPAKGS